MPLPVSTTSAGSIDGGGALMAGDDSGDNAQLASAVTPTGGQTAGGQASGSANPWMPVFQIGMGQSGVPTTARGLISGFQATTTVGQNATNQANTALQNALAANTPTTSGSSTGSSGPAAGGASINASPGTPGTGATSQYPYGAATKHPPPASAFNSQGEYIGDGLGNS
jgi:hypothetical protein